MAYNTTKLKARIIEMYGTQKAFAGAIGVEESTLSRYLKEGRDLRGSTLIKAVRALEIPDDEIDAYFFVPRVSKVKPKGAKK